MKTISRNLLLLAVAWAVTVVALSLSSGCAGDYTQTDVPRDSTGAAKVLGKHENREYKSAYDWSKIKE